MKQLSQNTLIIITSLFISVFGNYSFFKNVVSDYHISASNIFNFVSLFFLLFSLTIFLLSLFSSKRTIKPILIIVLMVSSFTSYFMDSYQVIIDDVMIRNMVQTNLNESLDLFSFKLIFYVLFLGILPSIFIYKTKIPYGAYKQEIISRIKILVTSVIIITLIFFTFSKFYTSFIREHKPLRFYTNPTYWIYSLGAFIAKYGNNFSSKIDSIGSDALINEEYHEKKDLIIMVIGEAARANRFSLNGYEKETNPKLKKEEIINFTNMYSCGTSTAVSVPCMFSVFDKDDYSHELGLSTYNVLDVLSNTKDVDILWRDNNSDSKGVALRVEYEDYRTSKHNTICDDECRDEGMIIGLDEYIKKHKNRDILIVLHQMGNHGPAYYKRYPKEFEKFTPVCKTNELDKCSIEEIGNAYDNAILYTDHFLSKVINFLKDYSNTHEATMIYMSDHGESLGENGLYLHGLPYFMAPDNQKHVGSIMWLGEGMKEDININKLRSYQDEKLSHDNLFDTLLGLFEVDSQIYVKEKDILSDSRIDK